jgi:hypothetical protein
MNCLNCDESKGFTFFPKTTNCLNCKSKNKYVNYEQTECIDEVPKGFYVNDTNINTIDKCYPDCLTCSAGGTKEKMNCVKCQPSLYLKDGNCVKTYTCPYKFFYQIKIDSYADINQKICLDENEICPCALPFYYTQTNECVESCPLELLLYQGCKISNVPYGLNKIISIVKLYFSLGMIDSLTKSFSLCDYAYFYNLAVKISVYSLFSSYSYTSYNIFRALEMTNNYQSLSDDNITSITENNYFEGSEIDLGTCEKKLREHYNIPEDTKLTIIKLDFKKNDTSVNNVQYEVFNPKNRSERLDLSICSEEKVSIKNPLDTSITPNRISLIEEYDLSNKDSPFFTDECAIYTSEEKTDVLIQDKYKDYYYKNKLCQKNCEFKEIKKETGEVVCLCPPNKGFTNISISNIEEIMTMKDEISLSDNEIDINAKQEYSSVNLKVLKCSRNIAYDFLKNYILIIYTVLLIAYIALSAIFFIFKNRFWKKYLSENETSNQISEKPNPPNKQKQVKSPAEKIVVRAQQESSKEKMKRSIAVPVAHKINDPDMFDYIKALNDTRSFLSMFFSSLKKREIIIFSSTQDQNIDIIKKLLLIFTFINYFATNAFFFSEKNIHQIYLDKGVYNFGYQLKYIICAGLISSVFLYLAKCMCINKREISNKNINCLAKKLIVFIGVSTCFFIFYWLYIGSLTSTYINSKKHLLINIGITFIFCCVLECLLALISAALRYIAIKKAKSNLYSMSKIINLL